MIQEIDKAHTCQTHIKKADIKCPDCQKDMLYFVWGKSGQTYIPKCPRCGWTHLGKFEFNEEGQCYWCDYVFAKHLGKTNDLR